MKKVIKKMLILTFVALLAYASFAAPNAPTAPISPLGNAVVNDSRKPKTDEDVGPDGRSQIDGDYNDDYDYDYDAPGHYRDGHDYNNGPGYIEDDSSSNRIYSNNIKETEKESNYVFATYTINQNGNNGDVIYIDGKEKTNDNLTIKRDEASLQKIINDNNLKLKNPHDYLLSKEDREIIMKMMPHYDFVAYSSADLIEYSKEDLLKLKDALTNLFNKAKLSMSYNSKYGYSIDIIRANLAEVIAYTEIFDNVIHNDYINIEDAPKSNIVNLFKNVKKEKLFWHDDEIIDVKKFEIFGTRIFNDVKTLSGNQMTISGVSELKDNLYRDIYLTANIPIEIDDAIVKKMKKGETIAIYNTAHSKDPIVFTYKDDYVYEKSEDEEEFLGVKLTSDKQKCIRLESDQDEANNIWYIVLDDSPVHYIACRTNDDKKGYARISKSETYKLRALKNARIIKASDNNDLQNGELYNIYNNVIHKLVYSILSFDENYIKILDGDGGVPRIIDPVDWDKEDFLVSDVRFITLDDKGYVTSICGYGNYIGREPDKVDCGIEIIESNVYLRKKADNSSEKVFSQAYDKGKYLPVYAKVEDEKGHLWYFVKEWEGKTGSGYIDSDYAKKVSVKDINDYELNQEYYQNKENDKKEQEISDKLYKNFKYDRNVFAIINNKFITTVILTIILILASLVISKSLKSKKGGK